MISVWHGAPKTSEPSAICGESPFTNVGLSQPARK